MLRSLHCASHGTVLPCFSLSFGLFAFPLLLSWAINSLWRVGMQLRLALGGSCSFLFPLGRPSTKPLLPLRHLHSLPNPCRFPAFLTLSQPSRREPGPPLSLLPVLLKGWSEQWPGDRPIAVFFCCGGCCCGKIWTVRTMGEMRHEN